MWENVMEGEHETKIKLITQMALERMDIY